MAGLVLCLGHWDVLHQQEGQLALLLLMYSLAGDVTAVQLLSVGTCLLHSA